MSNDVSATNTGVRPNLGFLVFQTLLAIGWLWLLYVTLHAVQQLGLSTAGAIFVGDFAHPWRAQFYTDFCLHVALVGAWIVYRTRPWYVGVLCALLAINGGIFTLAYLSVISIRAKGDVRKVLLGWRA
jgi:hypothetical protein